MKPRTIIKSFFDDFGNYASIDYTRRPAYRGGVPCSHYRLILSRDNYIYFVSVYESMKEACDKLKEFSCGTFKEVLKMEV